MKLLSMIDHSVRYIVTPHAPAEYFLYLVIIPMAMIGIQLSGAVDKLKRRLYYLKYTRATKFRTFNLKPLDCACCLSFWLVLIWSINPLTALAAFCLCYVYNRLIERV